MDWQIAMQNFLAGTHHSENITRVLLALDNPLYKKDSVDYLKKINYLDVHSKFYDNKNKNNHKNILKQLKDFCRPFVESEESVNNKANEQLQEYLKNNNTKPFDYPLSNLQTILEL